MGYRYQIMFFSSFFVFGFTSLFAAAYIKYIALTTQIDTIASEIASVKDQVMILNKNLDTVYTADLNFYVVFGVTFVVVLGVCYFLYNPEILVNLSYHFAETLCKTNVKLAEEVFTQNEANAKTIVAYLDNNVESHTLLLERLVSLNGKLNDLESQFRQLQQVDLPVEDVSKRRV